MKRRSSISLLLVWCVLGLSGLRAAEDPIKVIGYLASWSGQNEEIPRREKLTDLVKRAHASGVKVGIAIGGWIDGDDSAFEKLAASPESAAS